MMTFKHLLRTNLSSDFKKTTQKEKDAKFFGASFFPPISVLWFILQLRSIDMIRLLYYYFLHQRLPF